MMNWGEGGGGHIDCSEPSFFVDGEIVVVRSDDMSIPHYFRFGFVVVLVILFFVFLWRYPRVYYLFSPRKNIIVLLEY